MNYTVEALEPTVRQYDSKYGAMVSYKVKFKENDMWVEISQKGTTPPPTIGQPLEGTIDMSGQYGPKFKKDFQAGKPGGIAPARGAKTEMDSFTMYLSYAKDLAIANLGIDGVFNKEQYEVMLDAASKGGKALFSRRPGAETVEDAVKGDTGPDTPVYVDNLDPWSYSG